jgi:aarF domain-containing kinase
MLRLALSRGAIGARAGYRRNILTASPLNPAIASLSMSTVSSFHFLRPAFADGTFYEEVDKPAPLPRPPVVAKKLQTLSRIRAAFLRMYKALCEHVQNVLRSLHILLWLSPVAVLAPLGCTSPAMNTLAWRYTTHAIQSLGPTFIKFAQWAATRRDLFPQRTCDKLSVMHARVTPHHWEHTHETLKSALGSDYASTVSLSAESPVVGSGCVAQVYRGLYNDQEVAVKVIHPNVKHQIHRDLKLFKIAAGIIDRLPFAELKWFALPEAVREFETIMTNQIDLTLEAANLTKFREQFIHSPKVNFPKPLYSTSDVLIETFAEGHLVSEFFDAPKAIRRQLARPLLLSFLRMVFTNNFIHCDLHSGNVLAYQNGYTGQFELSILDAGIVTELKPNDAKNLRDLFLAVVLNQGEEAGRMIVERAKRQECADVDAFSRGIASIIQQFHDSKQQGLTLGAVRIGTLLSRVLELCRSHHVLLEPAMANVVLSTVVLEGVGRTLDEDMNLMDAALPFLMGRTVNP